MKKETVWTIVSVFLVIVVCLILWKDVIFTQKPEPPTVFYNTRVLIVSEKGDTIFDKTVISDTPLKFK